jgi:hypothetical protein
MKIINPIAVNDTILDITSVPTAGTEWNQTGAVTYADGDTVVLETLRYGGSGTAGLHHNYESLQSPNLNHFPPTNTAWWLDLGATNRWKAFDEIVGTQTTASELITYELIPGTPFDSVSLMDMDVGTATITLYEPATANAVVNGGFDVDLSSWASYSSHVDSTSLAGGLDGNFMKVVGTAIGWNAEYQTVTTEASALYRFEAFVSRFDSSSEQTYKAGIGTAGAGSTSLASFDGEAFSGALAWDTPKLGSIFTAPGTAVTITLGYDSSAVAANSIGYDRVSLRKLTTTYNTAIDLGASDPVTQKTTISRTDLPGLATSILKLALVKTGSIAKVGLIKVGTNKNVGTTLREPEVGFVDFSEWTTTAQGFQVTPGENTRTMTVMVKIDNSLLDGILRTLEYFQSTAAVFIADDTYSSLQLYGFVRSFTAVFKWLNHSYYRIKIDGKTQ